MAIAVKVVYSFVDDKGKTATSEVKVPLGFSIAQYIEFAEEMGLLIDAAVNTQMTSIAISLGVTLPGGLQSGAGVGADVEEKGAFQFSTVGGWKTRVNLPGLTESLVIAGTDAIDETDAAVAALITAFESGITLPIAGGTLSPCDAREDDIVSLDFARERFRAS